MMVMEIDAEAFTVTELMEMDARLRQPPPDAFQRLGLGTVSWLAAILSLFF